MSFFSVSFIITGQISIMGVSVKDGNYSIMTDRLDRLKRQLNGYQLFLWFNDVIAFMIDST